MKRRLPVVASVIALATILTAPAYAGRPAGVQGTIAVAGAETTVSRSTAELAYGQSVAFDTSVSGKMAKDYTLYVTTVCLQDDVVVYQWSGDVDFDFPLVDQPGQGLEWDGGAATCEARLIYRTYKGKRYTNTLLDRTTFDVAGA